MGLKFDGTVCAWGSNSVGQLGDGTGTSSLLPVQVIDVDGSGFLEGIEAIAIGGRTSLALKDDGTVLSWGSNGLGMLGDGTNLDRNLPGYVLDFSEQPAVNLSDIADIAMGNAGLAIKSDKTVWAWGGLYNASIPRKVFDRTDPSGELSEVLAADSAVWHNLAMKDFPSHGYTVSGQEVRPVDATTGDYPITMVFDNVTEPGLTFLTTSTDGPPPYGGFQMGDPPIYFYISTTAEYSGSIDICMDYSGILFNEPPTGVHHYENGEWVFITPTYHDPDNQIICFTVDSLSPFALFETCPDQAEPVIEDVLDPVCVELENNKKANMIRVIATDDCPGIAEIEINVTVFNKAGKEVKGKGIYDVHNECVYVYPNGEGWTVQLDIKVTDHSGKWTVGNVVKSLIKCN